MGLMTMNVAREPVDPVAYAVAAAGEAARGAAEAAITAAQAEVEHWSRQVSACALVEDLTDWCGVHSDIVWRCLGIIPSEQQWLLDSPGGWILLGREVQARLGFADPAYQPVVH